MKSPISTMVLCLTVSVVLVLAGCGRRPEQGPAPEQGTVQGEAPQAPAPVPAEKALPSGEALFAEHCARCHQGGGNVINPAKSLHREDLEANGVKTVEDILHIIRNPGPGMVRNDESAISDEEGRAIAEYILKTFG